MFGGKKLDNFVQVAILFRGLFLVRSPSSFLTSDSLQCSIFFSAETSSLLFSQLFFIFVRKKTWNRKKKDVVYFRKWRTLKPFQYEPPHFHICHGKCQLVAGLLLHKKNIPKGWSVPTTLSAIVRVFLLFHLYRFLCEEQHCMEQ